MSLFALPAPTIPKTDLDALIDVLDRAEPSQPASRPAFERLRTAYAEARRVRALIEAPIRIAGLIVVVLGFAFFLFSRGTTSPTIQAVLWGVLAIAALCNWLLRRVYPMLDQEDRVVALLRYYGAQGLPEEEEIA